ncbi:MAG: hypothetical protein ACRDST_22210 [Pseudonocardiaceae bacterium]
MPNLSILDADVVMISYLGDDQRVFLESNPVFQQLDAVRDGRYVRVEFDVSAALAFPSALSISYGLDRTVQAITAVLS